VKDVTKVFLPNLRDLARRVVAYRSARAGPLEATQSWIEKSKRILEGSDIALPDHIRQMFLSGTLTPSLLDDAVNNPDYRWAPYRVGNAERVRAAYEAIAREIRDVVRRHGGEMLLFSMPGAEFFDTETRRNHAALGLKVPPLGACEMDDLAAEVAAALGVHFVSVTADLRRRESREGLWFDFDGHLTPSGNRLVAGMLAAPIASVLDGGSVARGCR